MPSLTITEWDDKRDEGDPKHRDVLTLLSLKKIENEKYECYNIGIIKSGNEYNGKCDNLTDLFLKIENFLQNSVISAQTTNSPLTSDPFSNAGQPPQTATMPNNAGQSTQPPIPATPRPGPLSNAGQTPQPSATPNNAGQTPQPSATPNNAGQTPQPSATPNNAGQTPQPSATPNNAGQTPQPSATPNNAGQTPQPSATPNNAGQTPQPSATPNNAGQTPQPFGSPSNNPTSAPGNSGQRNTGPQNSNPPPTPNYNRAFILAGGTAVLGGGLAYAGYKARQAQAPKTKDGSTKSLQYSSKFRA